MILIAPTVIEVACSKVVRLSKVARVVGENLKSKLSPLAESEKLKAGPDRVRGELRG